MGGEQPFVGMLLLVPFNFAPVGWALCNGQLLSIAENAVLFQLIGTTYGGDGQNTFALPDLRGRVVLGQGSGYSLGQQGGSETVTLTLQQYPAHTHQMSATAQAQNTTAPQGNQLAGALAYAAENPNASMAGGAVSMYGGSQPHNNVQPCLAMNWIIALYGVFPSQN